MYKYLKYSFLVLFFTSITYAQKSNSEVKAKIVVEKIEGNIKVTGTAENLSEIVQSLTYKLTVIKKNKGNQSNNAQEGLFTLEPTEIKNLSTTQINLGPNDEITVLLLFYDEAKQLIGKDRVVIGGDEKKKDEVIIIPVDGIEMLGIVTNDTKTKVGKDFYDLYFYEYSEKNINAKKIITVSEELSFARNTKILITIDNVVVFEFLARPDEEFLSYMAKESLYETILYLKSQEKQSKFITQY